MDAVGQKMQPADVICLCEAGGKLRPLRIRIMDEQQVYQRVDIDQILRRDEIWYTGAEAQLFLCSATVNGRSRLLELKYLLRSHCWYLQGE